MPSINPDQANSIAYTIRTLRPAWNYTALMQVLTNHSLQNKPAEDIVLAAFRAATDQNAHAPTAINWDQYWVKTKGGNVDNGVRICVECLHRKPIGHMTTSQPPFICQDCA